MYVTMKNTIHTVLLKFTSGTSFRVLLGIIVLTGLVLRCAHISTEPDWFRDEGNYHAVCHSIASTGDPMLGPLNVTFCSPFMTQPPLYFYTGAAWLTVLHDSFTSLRVFNVVLSLVTLLFLYAFTLRHFGKWYALLAIAFFAYHPDILVFNKMIFPYNLYMLLGFLVFFIAIEYLLQPRSYLIMTSCILTGFAALSVYYAVSLVAILFGIIMYTRRWKDLPFLIIPPAFGLLFLGASSLGNIPGFKEDYVAFVQTASTDTPWTTLRHYYEYFTTNLFYTLGTLSLLLLPKRRIGMIAFLFIIVMLYPVMRKADTMIQFVTYPIIPLFPLIALGAASFVRFFCTSLQIRSTTLVLLISVTWIALLLFAGFSDPPLSFAMVSAQRTAREAAEYVNTRTETDDLVIASYPLWHLLDTKPANLPISLAYEGIHSDFFMYDISTERFSYNPSIDRAHYIIFDYLTSQMSRAPRGSIHYPVRKAIEKIKASWEKTAEFDMYTVYKNPYP